MTATPTPAADADAGLVEVTQADRDAAVWYLDRQGSYTIDAKIIRQGRADHKFIVQSHARHRLATTLPSPDSAVREALRLLVSAAKETAQTLSLTFPQIPLTVRRNMRDEHYARTSRLITAVGMAEEALGATPPAVDGEEVQLDNWIEWNGGECPVQADVMVQYRMADGYEDLGPIGTVRGIKAGNLRWHWIDDKWSDIIAYRVVQP